MAPAAERVRVREDGRRLAQCVLRFSCFFLPITLHLWVCRLDNSTTCLLANVSTCRRIDMIAIDSFEECEWTLSRL